ncbi:MAG: hypothetical protein KQH63_10565 [Desulfobulbaceae bacterium]|nr:hypothetical protein [Desulfobulbaceae bacterium]
MKYATFFMAFISCVLLVSCASLDTSSNEPYKRVCQSWMGHNINELIRSWGYPQRKDSMPNGNTLYTYDKRSVEQTPVVTSPGVTTYNKAYGTVYKYQSPGITTGGDIVTYYCITSFEVDGNGKIVFWRFEGNSCR